MGPISKSVVCLRIIGDDLIPDEISELLGCQPSSSQEKGEEIINKNNGSKRIAKLGIWTLDTSDCKPDNLNGQLQEIIGKLTCDLRIWEYLNKKYKIDFYCGLFMKDGNEGISISPSNLADIGKRGIELDFDIYSNCEE
jgi:hypothetical protein